MRKRYLFKILRLVRFIRDQIYETGSWKHSSVRIPSGVYDIEKEKWLNKAINKGSERGGPYGMLFELIHSG